jgi:hypothetical protein
LDGPSNIEAQPFAEHARTEAHMSKEPVHHYQFWLRTVIILIVAALFTLFCVSTSKQRGRLLSAPNYDDVVYFNQGSQLLQTVKNHGAKGLWQHLQEEGLHSPYSIGLAAAAYSIGGFAESVPYYANILVVLVYLGGLSWFLRALSISQWLASLGLFLTLPFITMGVVEFRPDIMWAVVTGIGVVFLATTPAVLVSVGPAAFTGLLLSLSLTIKPSTFAMTLILYGCAGAVRLFWERHEPKSRLLAGVGAVFCVAAVVAAPYWLLFGQQAWSYFWTNSFGGNKQVWAFQGSLSDFLFFYLTGGGWKSNVGIPGIMLTIIAGACAVSLWKNDLGSRRTLSLLGVLLAIAFLINTSASMKSPFLGGGIYGTWIFGCAYLIGRCAVASCWSFEFKWRRWTFNLLILGSVAGILSYRWPRYSDWGRDRPGATFYRDVNDRMWGLLERHRADLPSSILFMQAGPIIPEQVEFWFNINGLKVKATPAALMRSVSEFQEKYPGYDWIVIQEKGVKGSSSNMPSEAFLTEALNIILKDDGTSVLDYFTDTENRKIHVLRTNTSRVSQTSAGD